MNRQLSQPLMDNCFFEDIEALQYDENMTPLQSMADSCKLFADSVPPMVNISHQEALALFPLDNICHYSGGCCAGGSGDDCDYYCDKRDCPDSQSQEMKANALLEGISKTASADEKNTTDSNVGSETLDICSQHSIDKFLTQSGMSESWEDFMHSSPPHSEKTGSSQDTSKDPMACADADDCASGSEPLKKREGNKKKSAGAKKARRNSRAKSTKATGGKKSKGSISGKGKADVKGKINAKSKLCDSHDTRIMSTDSRGSSVAMSDKHQLSDTVGAKTERQRRLIRRKHLSNIKDALGIKPHRAAIFVLREVHKVMSYISGESNPIRQDGGIDLSREQEARLKEKTSKSHTSNKARAYREMMHRVESLMIVERLRKHVHILSTSKAEQSERVGGSNQILSNVVDILRKFKRKKSTSSSSSMSSSLPYSSLYFTAEDKRRKPRKSSKASSKKDETTKQRDAESRAVLRGKRKLHRDPQKPNAKRKKKGQNTTTI